MLLDYHVAMDWNVNPYVSECMFIYEIADGANTWTTLAFCAMGIVDLLFSWCLRDNAFMYPLPFEQAKNLLILSFFIICWCIHMSLEVFIFNR
jgi:hypothetical protein